MTLDRIFGSGSIAIVALCRVRIHNKTKMAIAMTIMPPTVQPIAGPITELEDTIRAFNLQAVKLTEMLTWRKVERWMMGQLMKSNVH